MNNEASKRNPLEILKLKIDLFEYLELWPYIKLDSSELEEIINNIGNAFSESLINANKIHLTKELYHKSEPNVFFKRELERVVNILSGKIFKIKSEFKKYPNFFIETKYMEYSLLRYFSMKVMYINDFCVFAKERIKEIDSILKKQNKNPETEDLKHPFKDDKTNDLFNYIIEKWKYDKDIKFAYIYNNFESKPYKNDYERFIRKRFSFKGLFNYNNAVGKKAIEYLEDLTSSFYKNYR